jgi:ubiquinone/menaquinone biosynthesis C-methylase UbiE
MEYVPSEAFGEDYLYFYDALLTDEVSDVQADRLWRLLGLESGDEVLDVPCGHGRIANGLAARGASVTGLDANPLFLERARTDAAARGVKVEYIQGDMRNLPWEERFDLVLNWFSSFGYFDDEGNRAWLREHGKRSDREVASSSNSGTATRLRAIGCR